jgi:hypothetical protein
LYRLFDPHDVGVETIKASLPFFAEFFIENANYRNIASLVLS